MEGEERKKGRGREGTRRKRETEEGRETESHPAPPKLWLPSPCLTFKVPSPLPHKQTKREQRLLFLRNVLECSDRWVLTRILSLGSWLRTSLPTFLPLPDKTPSLFPELCFFHEVEKKCRRGPLSAYSVCQAGVLGSSVPWRALGRGHISFPSPGESHIKTKIQTTPHAHQGWRGLEAPLSLRDSTIFQGPADTAVTAIMAPL